MILDNLPTRFGNYIVNTDFRVWIQFETLMQSKSLSDNQKLAEAFQLVFPVIPKNIEKAIQFMLDFYRAGKQDNRYKGKKTAQQIYSYEYDGDYIYGAFLDQYGIDLQDIEYLHWWKFKSMFNALKSENQIVKIMGFRAVDTKQKMSKEQREYYNEMKKIYAVPIPKDEQEKVNEIENALLNGGDISKILGDEINE